MRQPRLTYFGMRGRAEAIRLLLHATRTEFEDRRVVSGDEWASLRPTLPFTALPRYETESIRILESHAILRHLGRRLALGSANEVELAELDVAQEAIAESQEDLWRFNWSANYYEHLASYADATLRPRLACLEGWLARDGPGAREWFGRVFSHVDCLAFCFLDAFFPSVLAEFAGLAGLHSRVASLPEVSAYLRSADRPLVFGMGIMGPKVDPRAQIPPTSKFSNPWSDPIDLAPVVRRQRRLTSR